MKLSKFLFASVITSASLLFPLSAKAGGEVEHAQGLRQYKAKNYRTAAKYFETALSKGAGSAENYIYMAHSYAASGNIKDAVRIYQETAKIFKGLPAEKLARQCIRRIDPHGRWAARVRQSGGSGSRSANSSTSTGKRLVDRVFVIPPKKGHPSVSSATVNIVKQTLLGLPKHVYHILDAGGTTVHIGPNIIDKWPDAIYGAKPGQERITLSQETGRTYDRAVYLWERSIDLKTERLKPIRSRTALQNALIYVLGHAYNDCLGPLTETAEFKEVYGQDERKMSYSDRSQHKYFLQAGNKGAGDVFCAIFASYNGGERFPNVMRAFPKSTRFIRDKLSNVHRGGRTPHDIIATSKVEKPEDPIPERVQKKHRLTAHADTHKHKVKKTAAPFTNHIPKISKQHYLRAVGDRLVLPGTIEGKAMHWWIDTGAFETVIDLEALHKLGIPKPSGPPTTEVYTVAGRHAAWDMELDITVGDIRKTEKVKVAEKSLAKFLLGQPFLRDLNFSIDRINHFITFTKKEEDSKQHVHADSFTIPFVVGKENHMIVQAKANGIGFEMVVDTGAPVTIITGSDNLRLKLPKISNGKLKLKTFELGNIKKGNIEFYSFPNRTGRSILGQDFFGIRKYVIDNDKNVIRFVN